MVGAQPQAKKKSDIVRLVLPRRIGYSSVIENLQMLCYNERPVVLDEPGELHVWRRDVDTTFVAYYCKDSCNGESPKSELELMLVSGVYNPNTENDLGVMVGIINEKSPKRWITEGRGAVLCGVLGYVGSWLAIFGIGRLNPQVVRDFSDIIKETRGLVFGLGSIAIFAGGFFVPAYIADAIGRKFDKWRTRNLSDHALGYAYGTSAEVGLNFEIPFAKAYEVMTDQPYSEISLEKLQALQRIEF